jgi:hypothetical protein
VTKESMTNTESEVSLWQTAKWVAQFLGIVGGAGGGSAALAFGIGYLATKGHDAMLGLPTTTTSYAAYVRTGALFFPGTVHDVAQFVAPRTAGRVVIPAVVGVVLVLALSRWRALAAILERKSSEALFSFFCFAAAVLAVLYLPYHMAPLQQRNTGLLFQAAVVGDPLNAALRREDLQSTERLHQRYGQQCTTVLSLGYLAYALMRWRRRLGATPSLAGWVATADWLARPIVYTALAGCVMSIPTLYGILAVPRAPCVQPTVATSEQDRGGSLKGHGLLWSDLSVDTSQVIILEKASYGYAEMVYRRSLVRRLETIRCNLFEPPDAEPPQP